MFAAIDSVGKDVLIVKDNKVIAKGRSIAMRGTDYTSIRLSDEDFEKAFSTLTQDFKDILKTVGVLRVSPMTGGFIQFCVDFEGEQKDAEEFFDGSATVDAFNFGWGMVPDHFKEVEGYAARRTEVQNNPEQ